MRTCCCGCSLRTGNLIIGYLCTVSVSLAFGYFLLGAVVLQAQNHGEELNAAIIAGHYVVAAICLKFIAINVLFLVGVHNNKPEYMMPWLVWICTVIVLQSGTALLVAVKYITEYSLSLFIGGLIGMLIQFAWNFYMIMVVSSHYHNMKKKSSLLDEEELPL